jgi:asparagine synthase (glutamine-hydrolysing)
MCGIFGFISHKSDAVPEKDRLRETASLLQHRGPDARGFHVEPGVALVHTRLSLLDLTERGNQPFWDRESRYALIYNGEIYNFQELRAELAAEGAHFETSCDTEVLLDALLRWGPEKTLPKLEGMFTFALYDTREASLLVARDRYGIKPLFLVDCDSHFIFSSEIRALRPWMEFKPDIAAISSFLGGFSGPTAKGSFLEGVEYLDPGAYVMVKRRGTPERRRFFRLTDFVSREQTEDLQRLTDVQRIDRLDELLHKSVNAHLLADAPVGSLCSGGIDSSIIIAIAKRYHNNLAIFHANVVGKLSEFDAAAALARHLQLDIKSVDIRSNDFLERIPEAIDHYGLPFFPRPHSIPFRMVSQLAASHGVKALLSGEGADECFLGYTYLAPDIRGWMRPRGLVRGLRQLSNPIPAGADGLYAGLPYVGGLNPGVNADLITAMQNRFEVLEEAQDVRKNLHFPTGGKQRLGLLQSFDLMHYNLRSALLRNDIMGMTASIEGRFPFLDNNLVQTALNLPYNSKIRFSVTGRDPAHPFFVDKWIVRKVGERYLPKSLTYREKKPFWVDAYGEGRLRIKDEYFTDSFVARLFKLSRSETSYLVAQASHELRLKLLQLEVWAEVCLQGQHHEASVSRLKNNVTIAGD